MVMRWEGHEKKWSWPVSGCLTGRTEENHK